MAKLINMAKIATWSVADKGIGIAVVGNGLNRQDAGANAEGAPERGERQEGANHRTALQSGSIPLRSGIHGP